MMSEEAVAICQAIDRLTAATEKLVALVAKHAEAAETARAAQASSPNEADTRGEDLKELLKMDAPPPPPVVPEKLPTAAPPKTTLTSMPPSDALCRCMHQSKEHVEGIGACTRPSCSCVKFAYMVAPQPTPGACSRCGCAPSQVKIVANVLPPVCESCHSMSNLLTKSLQPDAPKGA